MAEKNKHGNCYVVVPENSSTYIYGAYPYTEEGKEKAEEHLERLMEESDGGTYRIKIK